MKRKESCCRLKFEACREFGKYLTTKDCGGGIPKNQGKINRDSCKIFELLLLVLDQSVDVVLGPVVRGGHFKYVGDAKQRFLGVAIGDDLKKRLL